MRARSPAVPFDSPSRLLLFTCSCPSPHETPPIFAPHFKRPRGELGFPICLRTRRRLHGRRGHGGKGGEAQEGSGWQRNRTERGQGGEADARGLQAARPTQVGEAARP